MATAFCLGLMRNICCTTLRIRRIGGRRLLPRVLSLIFFFRRGVRIINFHFNDLTHKNKNNERPDKMMMKNAETCMLWVFVVAVFTTISWALVLSASFVTHFPGSSPIELSIAWTREASHKCVGKTFLWWRAKGNSGICILYSIPGSGIWDVRCAHASPASKKLIRNYARAAQLRARVYTSTSGGVMANTQHLWAFAMRLKNHTNI